MMEEFYEELYGENVFTYRLTDGSYIIADELELDEESGAIFVADPLELIRDETGYKLRPWIVLDDENIVELNSNNVIARSSTAAVFKTTYLKFVSAERLLRKIDSVFKEDDLDQDDYDEVDKLGSYDDFFNKLENSSKSRWNWTAN